MLLETINACWELIVGKNTMGKAREASLLNWLRGSQAMR